MAGGDLVDGCRLRGCGLVIKKPGGLVAFITASAVGCRFWSAPKAAEKAAVVSEADKTRSDERRAVLCCMPAKAGNKRLHRGFAGTERSYRESAPQGAAPATGGAMSEHVPLRLRPAPADRNGVAGRLTAVPQTVSAGRRSPA